MSERVRNIIVGITALLGIFGIALMLLLFGYAPAWLEGGYELTITMRSASGLAEGSRVHMSGLDIGRIASVELAAPPKWGVVLVATIEKNVQVPRGVKVSVVAPIIGGSPALSLQPVRQPQDQLPEFLPTDGTGLIEIKHDVPSILGEFAAQLQSALKASIIDLKTALEQAQDKFDALSTTWIQVGQNLNELIEPRRPDQVDHDHSGQRLGNLSTVLARADARLRELEEVVQGMKHWTSDQKLRQQIHSLVLHADSVAQKMDGAVDRLVSIAQNGGQTFDRLSAKFGAVSDNLAAAVRSLRQVIDQAGSGEGTIAKALRDPALFNNLNDAFGSFSKALDEIKMLVEKWQKEGLPLKF